MYIYINIYIYRCIYTALANMGAPHAEATAMRSSSILPGQFVLPALSQNVFINQFQKVGSPKEPSTCCSLLLIEISS